MPNIATTALGTTLGAGALVAGFWSAGPSPTPVGISTAVTFTTDLPHWPAHTPTPYRVPSVHWAPTRAHTIILQTFPNFQGIKETIPTAASANTDQADSNTNAIAAATHTLAAVGLPSNLPSENPSVWTHIDSTGPSGGLAYALAYLDAATPGNLTHTTTVATGEVSGDGIIYPVSGLDYKWAAARNAHAHVMFVPARQGRQLDTYPQSPPIVEVGSVGEAAAWLCEQGADDEFCGALALAGDHTSTP